MNVCSSVRRLRHHEADLAGLVEAAERVFSDRGYHATSIRDIAREAGFSVGGVYQFFASKDELYLRVVDEHWQYFFTLLNEVAMAEGSEARLRTLVEAMFTAFEQRRGFFKMFLSERTRFSAEFTGEIAARVGEHTRRLRTQLVDLMRCAVDDRTLQPLPPELLASAFLGMAHHCFFEAMASEVPVSSRPTGEVLALFLHGAARSASSDVGLSQTGSGAQV